MVNLLKHNNRQPAARRRSLWITLATLLVLAALSACGAEAPEPTPTPTKTLQPTFTPTSAAVAMATQTADAAATEAARATSTPTVTSTPTETPVPTETPAPPTETPAPPTATPAPPTATRPPAVVAPPSAPPTAAPTQPPAPPPSGDAAECANLGGDGCKFRQRGGPTTVNNGGGELKLTLAFIHSGRNEAQGSYFVWLEKEGVGKLPVSDSVRSWTGDMRSGPSGLYNYEYKLGQEPLGGSVAGCYVIWVLDGNGQRDSLNYRFCVPDGQGEVWIEFDQG
jgi:hypothetical protein